MRYRRRTQAAALALFAALSIGISCGMASAACCPDISGHWAERSVERWYETGLVRGFEDGTFRPDSPMTRSQLAVVLSNLLALPEGSASPFLDVTPQDWFYPYLTRCYDAGILAGDNALAHPNELVTRQQTSVMLSKALKLDSVKEISLSSYSDETDVAPWAKSAMAACIQAGMMSGIGDGRLGPTQPLSRGALMTMLDRVVVQHIQSPGEYTLTDRAGIILVAAGNVSLRGKTEAKIILTHAATDGEITLEKGASAGEIIQLSDKINLIDQRTDPVKAEKPASGGVGGGSGGGGGGGGHSSTPSAGSAQDLLVSEAGTTVQSGTYRNVIISDRVADGEITLDGLTIQGDLTIYGCGSNTVKLNSCTVNGAVILAKTGGQPPGLLLNHTPIARLRVTKRAIVEGDADSIIALADFSASAEVRGAETTIREATFAARSEREPSLRMTGGTIRSLSVDSRLALTGHSGSVEVLIPSVSTTISSDLVEEIRLPGKAQDITIQITGDGEVRLRSDGGTAQVTAESGRVAASGTDDPRIRLHIHRWDTVTSKTATCTESGVLDHICLAENCPVPSRSEELPPLGHHFSEVWTITEEGHAHRCTRCGQAEDAASHQFPMDIPCDQSAVCYVCGYAKPTGQHIWTKDDSLTPATCTQAETALFRCQSCGVTEIRSDGTALGHAWGAWAGFSTDTHEHRCQRCNGAEYQPHTIEVVIPGKAETCTEPGYTEKTQCPVCNTTIRNSVEIPALGHHFGDGRYQSNGSGHWLSCTRCSAAGELTDHAWPLDAQCDKAARCQQCSFERAAGSHSFQFERTHKTPTCTERGEALYRCTACGQEELRSEGEPVGHRWGDWSGLDKSTHQRSCSVCKATEQGNHAETKKTEAVPATCTEDGRSAETVCSECCHVLIEGNVIPKLGHSYYYDADSSYHWKACRNCDTIEEKESHSYPNRTCTEVPVCAICKNSGDKLGHNFTKYGSDEDYHWILCSRCGALDTKTPHRTAKHPCNYGSVCLACGYEVAPAEHLWEDVWTSSDASGHVHKCTVCDTKEEEAHRFVIDQPEKEATCTESGSSEIKHCSICNYEVSNGSDSLPLGHDWDEGVLGSDRENPTRIYTCTRCNEKRIEELPKPENPDTVIPSDIWFVQDESGYITLNWSEFDLNSDEFYMVNNSIPTWSTTTSIKLSQLISALGINQDLDIIIGTHNTDGTPLTPIYTANNAWTVQKNFTILYDLAWTGYGYILQPDRTLENAYYVIIADDEFHTESAYHITTPIYKNPGERIHVILIEPVLTNENDGKHHGITLHCTPAVTLTVPEIPAG